jgi:hypothetical protein
MSVFNLGHENHSIKHVQAAMRDICIIVGIYLSMVSERQTLRRSRGCTEGLVDGARATPHHTKRSTGWTSP